MFKAVTENAVVTIESFFVEIHEENVSGDGWHSWRLIAYSPNGGWAEYLLPDSSPDAKRALQQLFKLDDGEGYYHLEDLVRLQP